MSDGHCSVHGNPSPCRLCLQADPLSPLYTGAPDGEQPSAPAAPDMVNHPPHYTGLPCGVEVIEITEHMPFSRGNAVKYLLRAGMKGGPEQEIEDLRKAAWYASREADRLEKVLGLGTKEDPR